jgi:hypothetical protein
MSLVYRLTCNIKKLLFFKIRFLIKFFFQSHYMFRPIWPSSDVKTVVGWKLLCLRYVGLGISFVYGPIYALVCRIVMDSCPSVLRVSCYDPTVLQSCLRLNISAIIKSNLSRGPSYVTWIATDNILSSVVTGLCNLYELYPSTLSSVRFRFRAQI